LSAAGSVYGNAAKGGVIRITTKKAVEGVKTSINLETGSYGFFAAKQPLLDKSFFCYDFSKYYQLMQKLFNTFIQLFHIERLGNKAFIPAASAFSRSSCSVLAVIAITGISCASSLLKDLISAAASSPPFTGICRSIKIRS